MNITEKDIIKISHLQNLFLKKRFLKELHQNKELLQQLLILSESESNIQIDKKKSPEWWTKDLDAKFSTLTNMISNKDNIKKISKLLNNYYRYIIKSSEDYEQIAPKLDARKFLCCFVMRGFPNIVLCAPLDTLVQNKYPFDYDIYTMSTEIILNMNKLFSCHTQEQLRKFVKSVNIYTNALNSYLYVDKCRKIDELVKQWYNIDKTKSEVEISKAYIDNDKKHVLTILSKSSDRILKLINVIDKNFNIEYLTNYKKLADKVNDTIRTSYWDILMDELRGNKFDMMFKLLDEIKDQLIMLKLNNEQYKQDLNEYIDNDFIKHKIDNGIMTPYEILKYGDYMVSKVAELISYSQDKLLQEEWNNIKKDIHCGKIDSFEKIVSITLQFILDKINVVKDDIYGFIVMKELLKS